MLAVNAKVIEEIKCVSYIGQFEKFSQSQLWKLLRGNRIVPR